ncbi:Meiotically up-regulated [Hyphodiscus hymeniophilus]|uniref:Meiotically up-regulated n=1 Tax=Hyphodiscus hymeniophilus TaxID=353542 RepID=A0A9P7AYL1_9HELO|nr:Meiotically up-regulated [Hyphodiscus hymeniophilus]
MADKPSFDEEASHRNYQAPYSHNHPIPTIQRYREHRGQLDDQQKQAEDAQHSDEDDSRGKKAFHAVKTIFKDDDKKNASGDPYPTANRNTDEVDKVPGEHDSGIPGDPSANDGQVQERQENGGEKDKKDHNRNKGKDQSATEKAAGLTDPREKRKQMKKNKRDDGGRVVTDPVTHLPLVIRDSTEKDMRRAPQNEPAPGMEKKKTGTGLSGASGSSTQLQEEKGELQDDYDGMRRVFPPPSYDDLKAELQRTYQLALTIGIGIVVVLATLVVLLVLVLDSKSFSLFDSPKWDKLSGRMSWLNARDDHQPNWIFIPLAITITVAAITGFGLIFGIRGWLGKRVHDIWEDEVWDAARSEEQDVSSTEGQLPESTAWVNGLLASVWPLINPDLFASVTDMLEDVMQASLPKVIRMVSVDDLGQGSEAIRILGIRSLPTGAASQSVDETGNLRKTSNKDANDRTAPGEGEEEDNEDKVKNDDQTIDSKKEEQQDKQKEQEQQAVREGMEAEQGDFINMELAFAYRARSSGKSLRSKAKNAHLYLKFYLPGGIFIPVWVELRGLIGTMRLRLQLTPDPPFFSLCTLTFLGQPRADLSCVPLSKHLPNLMDVPLISSVQSSIDAALAEYVAPKSLTLDLKDMLVGDDFKKDTNTRGLIVVFIKEARGFKEGDGGIGPMKGTSDAYVTCSWGKFGKTISSTRIIEKDQEPSWHEWAYLLVTPEELNADEKLRLQLWDSDKRTADDDLGRVEVDLKELMHSEKTKNKIYDREDRFMGEDADERLPGTLTWSVGYYSKAPVTDEQLKNQKVDGDINNREDLKKKVSEMVDRKMREATEHDESKETNQQKVQDYREQEDALICASSPDPHYPNGILSVQIHNITGLEVESSQKQTKEGGDGEDEAEQSEELPSSYCTIILNHKKVFRTRTKPKNSKPFFNAGTERFIRDWQNAEVMVSVRDRREGENDALLGIVYLPLGKVFQERSQVMDVYPLVGGIGFGRLRISMVFRSVELQLPRELLGWDYGTLEIKSAIKPKGSFPEDLQTDRIKVRSDLARGKLAAEDGIWIPKHGKKSIFLACHNRYSMPLVIEFRKSSMVKDSTPAFGVFWLKGIVDDEEKKVSIKIWKGSKENMKKATTCADYADLADHEGPLGEIELTICFWRGLSGYHKSYARKEKNGDMRNVMEVLDTVNDEIEDDGDESSESDDSDASEEEESNNNHAANGVGTQKKPKNLKSHTNDSDTPSESEASPEDAGSSTKNPLKAVKNKSKELLDSHNKSDDGSRGVMGQVKDYKDHRKQLHRKHKGLMQWKGMRSADWALDKVMHGKSKMGEIFEHKEKGQGVETEV